MPTVVDNVVLAMFVDAGRSDLLRDLAAGEICVTPSILDPHERPPFSRRPLSEFGRGIWEAQQSPDDEGMTTRIQNRTAFYDAGDDYLWKPALLTPDELRLAAYLTSREARSAARVADASYRSVRVDAGEAECAAVAIRRGWTLWSDDNAIVGLIRALYPQCTVERLCGLLMRAVDERHIPCEEAAHLYNDVFKKRLSLWTTLTLHCRQERAYCE